MATPYLQTITEEVVSTQDLARSDLGPLPQVVIASAQTGGRGRSRAEWWNADRALAVSVAWRSSGSDVRPFSLMAGVAAIRVAPAALELKWPNDVMDAEGGKVGGILVEESTGILVAGLGLNLYWERAPDGAAALFDDDPGADRYKEIGALWAAELMRLVSVEGWPIDDYRRNCRTLGRDITWEPNGMGRAADVNDAGALLVETQSGLQEIHAGEIRHVAG